MQNIYIYDLEYENQDQIIRDPTNAKTIVKDKEKIKTNPLSFTFEMSEL